MITADPVKMSSMRTTANSFARLASLRGISATIDVSEDARYIAKHTFSDDTPEDCGPSVHGLYDWLNRQPGVLP